MAFSIVHRLGPALSGAALVTLSALCVPLAAQAQARERPPAVDAAMAQTEGAAKRFQCQDGGTILTRFATQRGHLVAIVDAFDGDGPRTLSLQPYAGPPVELTWSDGRRTLTWSPGVQIMWMDASVHRMCGGGHHH
jgi:hypothetical protein